MDALCGFRSFWGFPDVFGRLDPGIAEHGGEARFGTYGSPDPASAWCRPRLRGLRLSGGKAPDDRPASQAAHVLPTRWRRGRWVGGLALGPSLAGLSGDRPLDEPPAPYRRTSAARAWRSSRTTRVALSVTETPWTQAVGHRCRHRPKPHVEPEAPARRGGPPGPRSRRRPSGIRSAAAATNAATVALIGARPTAGSSRSGA